MAVRGWWPLVACSIAIGACSDQPTQLVVAVDSDLVLFAERPGGAPPPAVPELREVRVLVSRPGATEPSSERTVEIVGRRATEPRDPSQERVLLPFSFGVAPEAGRESSPVRVEAIGLDPSGAELTRRVAVTRFIEGKSLLLQLFLSSACVGVSCDEGLTCDLGVCRPEDVDPESLPEAQPGDELPGSGRSDAGGDADTCVRGVESCNGVDDDCDGRMDEAFDLSNDPSNCGSCGLSCGPGVPCFNGACDPIAGIAVGGSFTCFWKHTGEAYCWGSNTLGQLGDGTATSNPSPQRVDGVEDVNQIAAGTTHACALTRGGTVACWGDNRWGKLGTGSESDGAGPGSTRPIGVLTGASQVSCGASHTCARMTDGRVLCWGNNNDRLLGTARTDAAVTMPQPVLGIDDALAVHVGGAHTCALMADRTVRCWGKNFAGQLGDGGTTDRVSPGAVPGISEVEDLVLGTWHTCALMASGNVLCWGHNFYGELGVGVASGTAGGVGSASPQDVVGLTDATQLSSLRYHVCATRASGDGVCWGWNRYGQLGTGETGPTNGPGEVAPAPVMNLVGALGVHAGGNHTCAELDNGEAVCWGGTSPGDGSTATSLIPGSSVTVP